jgi:hypothetical protein
MCAGFMNQRGSYAPIGIIEASNGPQRSPTSRKNEPYPESPAK